jgi:hypothetical protein
MNLTTHVEKLREQLIATTEIYGEEASEFAARVTVAIEPATRLVLLEALSQAADEITGELAPGSVDVRLRAGEPEFVVTPPPTADDYGPSTKTVEVPDSEDGETARLNLRLPENLKQRVEAAASAEGLSLNAWLIRAAHSALQTPTGSSRGSATGGDRFTGWVR